MVKFWEVRMRNKKGATELATFSNIDSAQEKLNSARMEYVMVSLLELERANNGTETQVHAWVYHNGELYNEITEPYRRSSMESEQASNTLDGVIPADAGALAAAKAAAKAEAKALKDAERAAAKEAKAAAKAIRDAEKAEAKAAKELARAEALARGEKVGGVRTSKWADNDVIYWGEKYAGSNPKREGSFAHQSFSFYQEGMTVKEYRESGALNPLGNINWDVDHGYIQVVKADAPVADAPVDQLVSEDEAA